MKGYVEAVAADRRSRGSVALLMLAALLMLFAWLSYYNALEPTPGASPGYQKAFRASRYGSMGWALFYSMLGCWLIAKSIRGFFALPAAEGLGKAFSTARVIANLILLYVLAAGSCEPGARVYGDYSDSRQLLGGAAGLVWLLFAVDLFPLVRRAMASLRARTSAFSFKRSTVGGTETGAVRIEGTVALGERAVEGGTRAGSLVYRRLVDEAGEARGDLTNFLLEADGHRLFVDAARGNTIVVPSDEGIGEIGAGDKVEVWGEVSRSNDAYRGQPTRLGPGDGRLYIFQGSRSLNRRLVLAAAVELAATASFVAVGATFLFFVFGIALFTIY